MRIFVSAIICGVALYAIDAYFFGSLYFGLVARLVSDLTHRF